jgi:hypothetical protein
MTAFGTIAGGLASRHRRLGMIGVPLMMLALLAADGPAPGPAGGGAGGDAAGLVARLGAPRYADREEAAKALEALGREAIPALKAARDAADPEVRSRATLLRGKIESALMVRPTVVRLDFEDRPLPEVVRALGERAGVPMLLLPENNPALQGRRVTLRADEPVTLWQALDRLGRAAGVQHVVSNAGLPGSRSPAIQLVARPGEPAAPPTSDSGPFRLLVQGIHYHRDLTFGAGGNNGVVFGGNGVVMNADRAGGRAATEQFYLDLQVTAEPRMLVSQNGPLKLVEAIDEKNQSLLPAGNEASALRTAGYYGMVNSGMSSVQLQVQLKHPAGAGERIKRLRGVVPVIVSTRKDDPLVIPLADAKGKTFNTAEWGVTVHEIKADADQPRTTIEISVRSSAPADPALGGRVGMELAGLRSSYQAQSQIEILDAQGRAYRQWFPASSRADAEELRMTLMLLPSDDVGAPAQIRFYDMARAATEATFEFHDIPMP